jgi:hypothetical protein
MALVAKPLSLAEDEVPILKCKNVVKNESIVMISYGARNKD